MQARDGNLFLTMGDHFTYRDEAQNLGNHLGKIVRINAGRLGAAGQSVRRPQRTPSRKSGATATATCRAPRCIPQTGELWSTSTARAAATRSTSRKPARTTAGR